MGGWLSTRHKAADMVMMVGLVGSVIFGLAIPFVGIPALTFALFGIAFAIAQDIERPIRYLGTGERMGDLAMFDAQSFVDALFA